MFSCKKIVQKLSGNIFKTILKVIRWSKLPTFTVLRKIMRRQIVLRKIMMRQIVLRKIMMRQIVLREIMRH